MIILRYESMIFVAAPQPPHIQSQDMELLKLQNIYRIKFMDQSDV